MINLCNNMCKNIKDGKKNSELSTRLDCLKELSEDLYSQKVIKKNAKQYSLA